MTTRKPYNSWAGRRPVANKRRRARREAQVAAVQRWAAGKTETIEVTAKVK